MIWICFGFRISDFELGAPLILLAVTRQGVRDASSLCFLPYPLPLTPVCFFFRSRSGLVGAASQESRVFQKWLGRLPGRASRWGPPGPALPTRSRREAERASGSREAASRCLARRHRCFKLIQPLGVDMTGWITRTCFLSMPYGRYSRGNEVCLSFRTTPLGAFDSRNMIVRDRVGGDFT